MWRVVWCREMAHVDEGVLAEASLSRCRQLWKFPFISSDFRAVGLLHLGLIIQLGICSILVLHRASEVP